MGSFFEDEASKGEKEKVGRENNQGRKSSTLESDFFAAGENFPDDRCDETKGEIQCPEVKGQERGES